MSAFPGVAVLSCAAVGPAAVDVSGVLAGAKISGFAVIPIAVDFPSAVDVPSAIDVPSAFTVFNVSGVPAIASLPALVFPAVTCVNTLVNIPFLPVLATLLLLASPYSPYIPAFFCTALYGPAVVKARSAVDVEFLAVAGVSALTPLLLLFTSIRYRVFSRVSGVPAIAYVSAVAGVPVVVGVTSVDCLC